jgi:arylamine N-acetyltransferase
MSELQLPIPEDKEHSVAVPREPDLRLWASMINSADHFLGCDSVGQHIAKAVDKTATVVIGSTVPINISYPNDDKFDLIDIGAETGRNYAPIRMTMDDEKDRQNDEVMMLDEEQEQRIVDSCIKFLGEGKKFEGEFVPSQQQNVCTNPDHNHNMTTNLKEGSRKERRAAERAERKEQNKSKSDFPMNNISINTEDKE